MDTEAALPFCADVARTLDEPLSGTAPEAARWLLVEVPGPWGAKGLTESSLDHEVAAELQRRCDEAGVRIQLLRRPDRPTLDAGRERTVYLANCRAPAPWVVEVPCGPQDVDLLQVPVDRAGEERPPTDLGPSIIEPLILVCTHAKRDVCCAVYGQAAYRALHGHGQAHVWETTHTGGHRFAPNLVVFPYGLTFGWVDPSWSNHLVTGLLGGEVDTSSLRGRAGIDRVLQAAEVAARAVSGDVSLPGPRVTDARRDGARTWVTLAAEGREVAVEVLTTELPPERLTSCTKGDVSVPVVHQVVHAAIA